MIRKRNNSHDVDRPFRFAVDMTQLHISLLYDQQTCESDDIWASSPRTAITTTKPPCRLTVYHIRLQYNAVARLVQPAAGPLVRRHERPSPRHALSIRRHVHDAILFLAVLDVSVVLSIERMRGGDLFVSGGNLDTHRASERARPVLERDACVAEVRVLERDHLVSCKGKGMFYIAPYPVRWTARNTLHFAPWHTCSFRPGHNYVTDTNSASLGGVLATQQLRAKTIHCKK